MREGGAARRTRTPLTIARPAPDLIDASRLITAAPDERGVLHALVRLAVPDVADACVIDVLQDGDSVRRVGRARSAGPARALARRAPLDPDGGHIFTRVLRTGRAEHAGDLLAVPLVARARPLGVLTLLVVPPRRFGAPDVALVQDLAARAALALDSARLAREVQDAGGARDQMLATLSHELRNAMNAILGWAQILRSRAGPTTSSPLAARALDTIERNTRLQAKLIEDLFDVSRIVSGKLALQLTRVDLATVVMAVVEDFGPAASTRGLRLTTALASSRVRADPQRLHQVVANLVGNAVKFTDSGGWIDVRVGRAGPNVELRVTDSGRGIEPELLPHVFDRFRQGRESRSSGLGLGLAIVRAIVELHGGQVRAESEGAGKGATLIVTLPRIPG